MKVLVIGSGAREHALCAALATSRRVREVLCAPGNPGIAEVARCLAITADDHSALIGVAKKEAVDLVVVGPEAPLVAGIGDVLRAEGIAVFGPSRAAAQLEGSKAFAKDVMREAGVPTAAYAVFDDPDQASAYVEAAQRPLVVKADGLAAGKGVVVASNTEEAIEAIDAMMRRRIFGPAGAKVVIEEVLRGVEVSHHAVCAGTDYVPLAAAQDHKRLLDGDRGPNTGGMGAYSPPAPMNAALERAIASRVIEPTLKVMSERGTPFFGVLFVGLMIVDGEPFVLEYNVRFGDPETTVVLPRHSGDLFGLLDAAARGTLSSIEAPRSSEDATLSVVIAASGYPDAPRKGAKISGIERARAVPSVQVFHAGTRQEQSDLLVHGGRVLTVCASGTTIDEAAERAYRAVGEIHFEGAQFRTDIGWQSRKS